jgi:hypothetical protein
VYGHGEVRPPRIIINGARELPELVRIELDFGDVAPASAERPATGPWPPS